MQLIKDTQEHLLASQVLHTKTPKLKTSKLKSLTLVLQEDNNVMSIHYFNHSKKPYFLCFYTCLRNWKNI